MGKLTRPDAFFSAMRSGLFGGSLEQHHVDGINATLAAAEEHALPLAFAAYVLATQFHETGGTMFPNRESLNYSVDGLLRQFSRARISAADANRLGRKKGEKALSEERQAAIANLVYGGSWGRANLGNTQPNDGWHFRGGGVDHCTGRRNFRAVADALGLGDALMVEPDLILQPAHACEAAVTGMLSGRYTGRKLSDYLPTTRAGTLEEFTRSRPIINGTDRARDVAGYAVKAQAALIAGGYSC
jgi:putative chitinase